MKWNDARPSAIKKVLCGHRETVFPVANNGQAPVLEVESLCVASPGFATGELVLELDDPASPRIVIPYSYMVRK